MPKCLSHPIAHIAVDLYNQIAHSRVDHQDNVIYSPLSVAAVLAMALGGAGSKTADELFSVLHAKGDKIHEKFAEFLPKLSSHSQKVHFYVANRIYSDQKFPVLDSYANFLKESYGSAIVPVDFENSSEAIRVGINVWAKTATASKIADLLKRGTVGPSTSVMLVNATYFKGAWKSPFKAGSTSRRDFHVSCNAKVQVEMMNQQQTFATSSCSHLKARAIELLYDGGNASMVILLPDEIEGLSHLERNLSIARLKAVVDDLKDTPDVMLSLPKVHLEQGLSLKNALVAMGVVALFSNSCDLSAAFMNGKPVVSDIVHKSLLNIDEEGTEPASSPAETVNKSASQSGEKSTEFIVDHPFMWFIKRQKPGVILFMGAVRKP